MHYITVLAMKVIGFSKDSRRIYYRLRQHL